MIPSSHVLRISRQYGAPDRGPSRGEGERGDAQDTRRTHHSNSHHGSGRLAGICSSRPPGELFRIRAEPCRSGAYWLQSFYGGADNPVLSGGCGEMVNGVYMMVPPIDSGVTVDCSVPVGVPIVLSHAGYTAWYPDDGNTDQEIEDAASAFFGAPAERSDHRRETGPR